MNEVYIIMGVSGSGKSTVGKALAEDLDCAFIEGDEYHPPENIAKMSQGKPLNDLERRPWLAALSRLIHETLSMGKSVVVACSALKRSYRDQLADGSEAVVFVYLQGDFDLIWSRISARENHFMKPDMLQSQFNALEEPGEEERAVRDVVILPVDLDVQKIVAALKNRRRPGSKPGF